MTPEPTAPRALDLQEFARRLSALLHDSDSKIVWFIGAGCSVSSGVPTAASLVSTWLPQLKEREEGSSHGWQVWASERFPGFRLSRRAAHYGEIIDALFDVEELRQREVERITSGVDPGVGYAVLAQLMTNDSFGERCNVVLTTNFDDLVADALYLTTTKKPLVVVHESLAPFARKSAVRPLVVKLHGDARLAPRNTPSELRDIDDMLTAKVGALLDGAALVFLGYAGRDESILRLFESVGTDLLRQGVYWVNQRGPADPMERVLSSAPSFHVHHSDFDELMITLADALDISLPSVNRWERLFDDYSVQLTLAEM